MSKGVIKMRVKYLTINLKLNKLIIYVVPNSQTMFNLQYLEYVSFITRQDELNNLFQKQTAYATYVILGT